MGDNNMGNLLIGNAVEQRLYMSLIIRPRVDHSDFTFAQYVGTRSMKCKRTRVPGSKTAKTCSHLFNRAVGEVMVFDERNFDYVDGDLPGQSTVTQVLVSG